MNRRGNFFVYMIQDRNGTFYTGFTKNIDERIERHEKGFGAKYLKGRKPLKLVFRKEFRYYKSALNAERKIKQYTRKQKEELVRIYEKNK